MLGLVGRKCGMTRVFNDDGTHVPVTVIEVEPNRVTQVKTVENDGYSAVQVTVGERRLSRVTKPLKGHYEKAGVQPGRGLWEFRLNPGEGSDLTTGSEIKADLFANGQFVDVTGVTVGKGFQGVVKRHHFRGGRASHGCSLSHRAPGSIGQRQTPGRTFLNMKMAGHMGDVQRTVQNLQVVRVDLDRNVLLVKGGVPGAEGSDVIVRPAIKKMKMKKAG